MSLKVDKFLALNILVLFSFSTLLPAAASYYFGNIPEKTLQIAKDTMSKPISINNSNSKIIRVGIGSQDFSSYEWKSGSLYTTGAFELYNNKTYINTYLNDEVVNINMVGKIFVLTDSKDNVIAKVSGPVVFKSERGFLGVKDLRRAGKDALYRGDVELVSTNSGGKFYIVNKIDVENYLKGVVPNEMPVHFGLEALKAQSVAARNYVLSPRVKANPNYDVVDSVASQVYFGANTEKELSDRAVYETMGIVATYNWDLILALYSSTAGGYTESYSNAFSEPYTKVFPATEKPYLVSKPDSLSFDSLDSEDAAKEFYTSKPQSYDIKSSYYRWNREWFIEELQQEVQNHIAAQSAAGFVHPEVKSGEVISPIIDVRVVKRGCSGKIIKLEIKTTDKTYTVEKELVIRRLFTHKGKALPSANFVFENEYDDDGNLAHIKIYGGGYGHGVGMSQYGAGYMASYLGMTYETILQHYYTGVSLTTIPFILSSNFDQNKFTQTFYTKTGKAKLVVDNKYKVNYIDLNINSVDEKIKLDPTQRINKIDLTSYLQKGLNTIIFYYPVSIGSNKGLRMYVELAGANEFSN